MIHPIVKTMLAYLLSRIINFFSLCTKLFLFKYCYAFIFQSHIECSNNFVIKPGIINILNRDTYTLSAEAAKSLFTSIIVYKLSQIN